MIPLLTADEVRASEAAYEGELDQLMERAGAAVAAAVIERFPGRVTVVCGKGNNGGDGRVCARVLEQNGRDVTIVEGFGELGGPDVIVDALLGIGISGAPREDVARMIERINGAGKPVVAVDIPSGVNASTGEIEGAAVDAAVTVTFGSPKVGLAVSPGRSHAGSVEVADIGLAAGAHEHELVPASGLATLPPRTGASTKYSSGHVLIVGGSPGMSGAPALAALATFRSGAGYVKVATPESVVPAIETHVLEAVKLGLPEDAGGLLLPRAADAIVDAAQNARAVVIGPGLGRSDGTKELVRVLLSRIEAPVVLDADALFELEPFERGGATILTPHSGELARLLGTTSAEIDAHRLESVRRAASRFGSVVLLKGADTLVATPREGVLVAAYGTPALATAGTGDVLSGVIGAFVARGVEPRRAAALGAVAHGLASQLVEPQEGMVASDLLPALRRVVGEEGWDREPLA